MRNLLINIMALLLLSLTSGSFVNLLQANNTTNYNVLETVNSSMMYSCKDATLYLDESGSVQLSAYQVVNGPIYSDPAVSLSQYNFHCEDVGVSEITVTTTSSSGNSSTCISNVTLIDDIVPTAICQDRVINLDASGHAIINFQHVDNGSFDNCDFSSIKVSPYEFTDDDLGPNEVTTTITDASGNESSCLSTITIVRHPKANPTEILAAFNIPSSEELPPNDDDLKPITHNNLDRLPAIQISMNLYPNPTYSGETTVLLNNMNQGVKHVSISLYNAMGSEVSAIRTTIEQTEAKLKLDDLSNFTSGIYTVVVLVGNNRLSERIVIRN